MILVDLNSMAIANFIGYVRGGIVDKSSNYFKSGDGSRNNFADKSDDDLLRHMILNSLAGFSRQFKSEFGKIVLCCDSRHYWRKAVFPYYKAKRKDARDQSVYDWAAIHTMLDTIKAELTTALPYRIIEADGGEADDVIGTLVSEAHFNPGTTWLAHKPIVIISADQDFLQLQRYQGVKQYDPRQKRFLTVDNPETSLREKIIRGDAGDGIPSILSEDNIFLVPDKRQKPLMTKKVDVWKTLQPAMFCEGEMLDRFRRNEALIDLMYTPATIKEAIINRFESYIIPPKQKLMAYFVEHGLREMASSIGDF